LVYDCREALRRLTLGEKDLVYFVNNRVFLILISGMIFNVLLIRANMDFLNDDLKTFR
jgi:hypothetical protein